MFKNDQNFVKTSSQRSKNVLILLRGGVNATRNRAREISYPEEGHESNTVDFSNTSRTPLTGHKSRFSGK
jgi:hypothetical protein